MRRTLPLVAVLLVVSAGCNSDTPAVPTQPAPITTERFSGTVAPGGRDVHGFTVALSNGLLTLTLTAAAPPANVAMSLGQPDASGVCAPIQNATVVTGAGAAPQISGNVPGGPYCTVVADPGQSNALKDTVSYSLTVTHY
jgi:hypothetical protein